VETGTCPFCGNDIPFAVERCPHCGRLGLPPNVKAAGAEVEREALQRRYEDALEDAEARGCRTVAESLEAAAKASRAILNRSLEETERLTASEHQIYATYYERLDAGVQSPYGDAWDLWRRMADATLFPLYEKRIRFAALSLDGIGVQRYGDCSLVLRDELIEHRATVFEDNSAVFLRDRDYRLLPGHRATWEERSRLCVAKLSRAILMETTAADFPGLLLCQGATAEDDRFVEVHIWGPLTARSFERAVVSLKEKKRGQAFRKALRARLAAVGVELEVR
jgi:hypothetical protein